LQTVCFSPTYAGDLSELFRNKYIPETGKETINGVFTISKEAVITDIEVKSDIKHSKKWAENTAKILKSTEGHWELPIAPAAFKYKVSFFPFLSFMKDPGQMECQVLCGRIILFLINRLPKNNKYVADRQRSKNHLILSFIILINDHTTT
jgi:hypothetical protein